MKSLIILFSLVLLSSELVEASKCQKTCTYSWGRGAGSRSTTCSIECPVGKAAYCYCKNAVAVCECR